MSRTIRALCCLLLLAGAGAASDQFDRAEADAALAALRERGVGAMGEGDFAGAADAWREARRIDPTDKFDAYNLACALAMLGENDDACERLLDALGLGFVDFHHMERDPHLEPIRRDPRYRAIVDNRAMLLDRRAEAEMAGLKLAFDRGYEFRADPGLRFNWVCSLDEPACGEARAEAGRVARFGATIFDAPDPASPDPWVAVILPTPGDFVRMVGAGRIGGFYDRDAKRLVSRDIGPSLRHELFHALHWRDMDRRGQTHPIWIQEGLASLVEDVAGEPGEPVRFVGSWRTNIASRMAAGNRLVPLERLAAMGHEDFVTRRPRANYAQARALMLFLHERGELGAWYRAYVASFEDDPTGLRALEATLGTDGPGVHRAFRAWAADLERVGEVGRPFGASLGVALAPGRGDGVKVDEVVSMRERGVGGETGARLRYRDVITSIDGRTVRTLDDLARVLGAYEVGDEVDVGVRRAGRALELRVTLVPASGSP